MRARRQFVFAFILAAGVLAGGTASTASAAPITFNFEELSTGTFTTVTSTQGGITATIQRLDGGNITIQDLTPFGSPASFGHRTVGNFISTQANPAATLIVNFSQPVSNASISFGDYAGDDDSPVVLTAFPAPNGLGAALASATTSYPLALNIANGDSDVRSLSVSAAGIESLTLTSGGPFPGTLYYDNLVVTPAAAAVPEPSSLALLGLGTVALAGWRRWKKRPAA